MEQTPVELVGECRALAARLRALIERAEQVDREIARRRFDVAFARSRGTLDEADRQRGSRDAV